jgi:MFS transporter, DHA1 family, multidrug resistance protein
MQSLPPARFLDRRTPPHIISLTLIAGLAALNMSVFLPSLAHMAEEFGTDYSVMQLAVSGYLAATAVLQVFVGPLSDRMGRRPVLLGALAIFLVATLVALIAPNVWVFLAARLLQAAVATALVLSRAIVRDMVPAAEAASMIGYVTMGMALIPMIGPMIGGALDVWLGWRATFGLLLIAGAGALWLTWADLGETLQSGGLSFRDQLRGYPALLTARRFWGYAACAAFGSGAFFALLGGASFLADEVFGLSPFWTGMALGAPAIGYAVGNYLSGRFAVQAGINRMALIGTLVAAGALSLSLLLTLLGYSHPMVFFGFCTFLGLGNGIMLPSATAGLLSVRPELAGTASGLGGALMIGGGAALSAIAGTQLDAAAGPWPLQAIMAGTAILSLIAILYVIARERQLRAQ